MVNVPPVSLSGGGERRQVRRWYLPGGLPGGEGKTQRRGQDGEAEVDAGRHEAGVAGRQGGRMARGRREEQELRSLQEAQGQLIKDKTLVALDKFAMVTAAIHFSPTTMSCV